MQTIDQTDNNAVASQEKEKNYFLGGHWGQCVELLRHLCQYGNHLILVSGPNGIGKTTLATALQEYNPDQFKFHMLQANRSLTVADLMQDIAAGFGLPWEDAENDKMIDNLQSCQQNKKWVLLLDNADLLAVDLIEALIKLGKTNSDDKNSLQVVLFATPELEQKIAETPLQEAFEIHVNVIELEALTLLETESFIKYQWRLAGNHGILPFDKDTLKCIHARSCGIPGEIEKLVDAILAGKEIKKMSLLEKFATVRKFISPAMIGLTVFFGGMFLLISFFLPQDSLDVQAPNSAKLVQQAANISTAQVQPASKVTTDMHTATKGKVDEQLNHKVAQLRDISQQQSDIVSFDHKSLEKKIRTDLESEYKQQLQVEQEKNKALADALQLSKENNLKMQLEIKSLQENLEQSKSKILSLATAKQPKQSKAVPVKRPKNFKHAKSIKKIQRRQVPIYTGDEKHILNQPAKNYTLQLLGTSQRKGIEQYIQVHNLQGKAYYFKTTRQGKPWYILIYGSYKTRDLAQKQMHKLSNTLKDLKPWPREINTIQHMLKRRS